MPPIVFSNDENYIGDMRYFLLALVYVLGVWMPLALFSAPQPVLFVGFNEGTSSSVANAGSGGGEMLILDGAKQATSLFSADAAGVTGKPGDFALDMTKTATAMGVDSKPCALVRMGDGKPKTLMGQPMSFTVTGWFKTTAKLDKGGRLFELWDPLSHGFSLMVGPGVLVLSLNKKTISSAYRSKNFYGQLDQWVFFAVTYDGSKTSDNVVFYSGTNADAPVVVNTESCAAGAIEPVHERHGLLLVGNNSGGIRPFFGLMDDVALYLGERDGSGALSAEQIKEVYDSDLSGASTKPAAGTAENPSAVPGEKPLKLALIGDSTVCDYPDSSLLRGWGQMMREYLKPGVTVLNQARGGKSSKTFPSDLWQAILASKPDFVFIMFGANDAHGKDAPESTDAATDYKENLRRYITEARGVGIVPVLVTPPHRRLFYNGKLSNELEPYATAMREVGAETKVGVIDLYQESGKWLDSLGEEKSTFATVNRGPNPNTDDRSHYTKEGAFQLAKFVTDAFAQVDPKLTKALREQSTATVHQ